MPERPDIQLDGSEGEGGGQILRTALTLSAITGKSFEMVQIRAGRQEPGLKPQHLADVRATAAICGAAVEGDERGSRHLLFRPGPAIRGGAHLFEIGTAGSTALLLQTVALPLCLAADPSEVRVRGGTHVPRDTKYDGGDPRSTPWEDVNSGRERQVKDWKDIDGDKKLSRGDVVTYNDGATAPVEETGTAAKVEGAEG